MFPVQPIMAEKTRTRSSDEPLSNDLSSDGQVSNDLNPNGQVSNDLSSNGQEANRQLDKKENEREIISSIKYINFSHVISVYCFSNDEQIFCR